MNKKIHEKRLAQWTKMIEECDAILAKETTKTDSFPTIVELSPPVKQDNHSIATVSKTASAFLHVNGVMIELTESASADFIQKVGIRFICMAR